jgi:hypothetical protein
VAGASNINWLTMIAGGEAGGTKGQPGGFVPANLAVRLTKINDPLTIGAAMSHSENPGR